MDQVKYNRVGRRCHGMRGFRLSYRRFSVQRLRARFLYLFRLFTKLRSSYGHAVKSVKRHIASSGSSHRKDGSSRRRLVLKELSNRGCGSSATDYRLRSFARTNSFYAEAIADCLEFIKRSSVSLEDKSGGQM